MREWKDITTSHRAILRGPQACAAFKKAREQLVELARFESPESLVEYLNDKGGDLVEKNQIYCALVTAYQQRGPFAGPAFAILWLGLLPGLDNARRKELNRRKAEIELRCERPLEEDERAQIDPSSEFYEQFVNILERLDLTAVKRIAATMVRGVARDVSREYSKVDERTVPYHDFEEDPDKDHLPHVPEKLREPAREYSDLGLPPSRTLKDEFNEVRLYFDRADPDAADLALDFIYNETPAVELGAERGIGEHAVRKRAKKACERVRTKMESEGIEYPMRKELQADKTGAKLPKRDAA